MKFCLACRRFSAGGPLCSSCGRSFGGRLCQGKGRHLNPHDANFCSQCGTASLYQSASSIPLGWLSRLLLFAAIVETARTLWSHLSWPQGLTGYHDVRIWIMERLGNVLIVLFVFYFLSAWMPGGAGKQFRAVMTNILLHSTKLFFKLLERGAIVGVKFFLKSCGLAMGSSKKKP